MTSFDQEYKKTIQERSDSFMKHVATVIAEDYATAFRSSDEINDSTEIPRELRHSLQGIVADFEKRDRRRLRMKQSRRIGKIAAAVFLCFVMVSTILVVSVEAFRLKVIDFIMTDHGEYVDLNPAESGTVSDAVRDRLPETWEDAFYPSMLPEGYIFGDAYDLGKSKTILFVNEKQETITITFTPIEQGQRMADSEGSNVERITINGNPGICFTKEERTILHWSQSGYEFNLIAFLPEDASIEIAENMKYVNFK